MGFVLLCRIFLGGTIDDSFYIMGRDFRVSFVVLVLDFLYGFSPAEGVEVFCREKKNAFPFQWFT